MSDEEIKIKLVEFSRGELETDYSDFEPEEPNEEDDCE